MSGRQVHRTIWVTFRREGIHRYPEAGSDPGLADVSFLAHPHRHIFHFEIELPVDHSNRDLEFIQVKREIEGWYNSDVLELDYKSCEMIAEELANRVIDEYGLKWAKVTVSEDGENGANVHVSC